MKFRRPELTALIEWVLLLASYAVLFFEDHWVGSDGGVRFDALSNLLEGRGVSNEKYSLVGPLLSAPLWYSGKVFFNDARAGCSYFNWVVFGIGLVIFARLLRGLLSPTVTRRFLLLLTAGSMFTYNVGAYYGEVFTAICVAAGLLSVCTMRSAWLGWIAVIVGTANTPAAVPAAAAICLWMFVREKRLRYVIPVLAMAALIAGESVLRRGGLQTGYEGARGAKTIMPYSALPDFSYPLMLGILGLTLSFGKGIAFYAPGILCPVKDRLGGERRLVATYRLWILFVVGLILTYAKYWSWYGGEFWGPRYILFASIPASFALALALEAPRSAWTAMATLAVLTLSIWIGADGAIFGQENLGLCSANNYALEHLCWDVPEFAAWIRPFIVHRPLTPRDWVFMAVYAFVYVYLAAPLVVFLARAIVRWCAPLVRRVHDWKAWSF